MARFTPSDFQIDIFNAYNSTRKNLVIQAVPGSGKTTTILQLTKFLKRHLILEISGQLENFSKRTRNEIDGKNQ